MNVGTLKVDAHARDAAKLAARNAAAIEACRGLPTAALLRIAALPIAERPAALAAAAARRPAP